MEKLKQQVRRAQRRLAVQQYLGLLAWCPSATFLIATIAIAVAKIWPLNVDGEVWAAAWIGGALAVGLISAAVWTWLRRRSALGAAIEIDHRYGLKERVSSALALAPAEVDTEAGRALLADTLRRVERIDVTDRFGISLSRSAWLPLAPALAAFALAFFVGDKAQQNQAVATTSSAEIKKQIRESSEVLRKKMAERQKEAAERDLKDAAELFQKLEEGLNELTKKDQADRQQAMIKLNDLAKELSERRNDLAAGDKLKQQLDQLKNLQQQGPADKLAGALKNGEFKKAIDELQKLKDQLAAKNLDEKQKADLAAQLNEMKEKLQKVADAHQQMKQELQEQIQQAKNAGNLPEADKLQQQLDKLARQSPQMDKLRQMAGKMDQAQQSLKDGQVDGAQAALDQLANDLEQLQQQNDELKMLDMALDQIAEAKDAMNCKACEGGGCEACQGKGLGGKGPGKKGGDGLGAGEGGFGERPEQKTDTSMYDSKVDQNIRRGAAVVTDRVEGPNVKGQVQEQIKTQLDAAVRQSADPLTGQRLPRNQRDHAQQYFDSLRDGK